MTPRSSVRARAREIYSEMAEATASAQPMTPESSPRPARAGGGGEKNDLTARVRDLYENSAVPVREIARIAGVTERTLYRYVEKGDWKRRYHVLPRGEAAAAANRGRRWEVSPGRATDWTAEIAPAKGAGGRFIRREDKGKPFATGLKALDPAGRSRALATAGKAKRLSRVAQDRAEINAARAELMRDLHTRVTAIRDMVRYLSDIRKTEAMLKKREAALLLREEKASETKTPEQLMEMRVELARRIHNMVEQDRLNAGFAAENEARYAEPAVQESELGGPPQPRFDPDDFRLYGPPPAK